MVDKHRQMAEGYFPFLHPHAPCAITRHPGRPTRRPATCCGLPQSTALHERERHGARAVELPQAAKHQADLGRASSCPSGLTWIILSAFKVHALTTHEEHSCTSPAAHYYSSALHRIRSILRVQQPKKTANLQRIGTIMSWWMGTHHPCNRASCVHYDCPVRTNFRFFRLLDEAVI